jgi:adenylate cyclase
VGQDAKLQHRLAAIMATDVVGYSQSMQADEAGTLAALSAIRQATESQIRQNRGRIANTAGDSVLAEFASAVDAVRCALALQDTLSQQKLQVRIGIHTGDVIDKDGDLFGTAVNVAARLESLAQSGGIVVSAAVRDDVLGKLTASFADLGEIALKNIAQAVRVYSLIRTAGTVSPGVAPAGKVPPLTDKPSIAVLPFTNMSRDQDQQYLSDGITEDIITELSRFHSLLVIARNSSFQFRGSAVEIAEVHRKLGARYVVEGSLRKLGDRMRITAQLIDGTTGTHLWAERYDRDLKDIYTLQDDVVASIVSMVEGHASSRSASRIKRKPLNDWAAYDYYLRGREHHAHYELGKAEPLFARCTEIDPEFAQGHAFLAQALIEKYWYDGRIETLLEAKAAAQTALTLDKSDAVCHQSMGLVLLHSGQHAEAGISFDRARVLNPIDVNILGDYANWLNYGGRPKEALQVLEMALLREPLPPTWFWEVRGSALFLLSRYEDAITSYRKAGTEHYFIHAFLAAAYALSGQSDSARREVAEALRIRPDLSVSLLDKFPFADRPSLEHYITGFRLAGFPEKADASC